MLSRRKKWSIMAVVLAMTGGTASLLVRWNARSDAPGPAPSGDVRPAGLDSNEHELKALTMQLEKKPGHSPILLRMAQLARETGRLDDSARYLLEILSQEPDNVDTRLELGRVLFERGDVSGALAQTNRILESNPKHVDALYNLGAIYGNLGNTENARLYFRRAVDSAPETESGRKARQALGQLAP